MLLRSYSSIFRLGLFFALPFFIGAMLFLWTKEARAACSDVGCEEHEGYHICAWKGSCGGCSDMPAAGGGGWQILTPSVPNGESNPCYLYGGVEGEWCWFQQWTGTCGTCCGGGGGYVVFSGLVIASDTGSDTWTTTCSSPPCPVPPPSPICSTGRRAPNLYLDCRDNTTCSHPTWTCSVSNPTGGFFQGTGKSGGFIGVDLLGIPAPYNGCDWWILDRNNVPTGEHGEGCTAWFNPGTSDRDRAVRFRMKTNCPCGSCFTICSCASVAVNSPAKEFAKKTGEKAFVSLADSKKSVYDFSLERLTASFTFNLGKIFQSLFTFINNLLNKKIITNLRIWRD